MQETHVRSLGWEDPLEKEMATLSTVLAWRIPWTEEPGGLQPMGSQSHLEVFTTFFNLILNLAIRSSWSEPQSAPGLVFAALGSPIFPSGCEGKLGVALESLQGKGFDLGHT